jgi:hypothetical protein
VKEMELLELKKKIEKISFGFFSPLKKRENNKTTQPEF